ncbi:MAG: tetratricopeptide repeat protein [Pseudomonadota bacterium]
MIAHRSFARIATFAIVGAILAAPASAQFLIEGQAIENILVSKQDDEAIVRILPTCRMRYLVHSPPKGGSSVRIRVTLGRDCADSFDTTVTESFEPAGRGTASLINVTFDAVSRWNGNITLNFSRPRTFTVAPGDNGWIEVRLDDSREAVEFADAVPDPLPQAPPPVTTPAERIDNKRARGPAANLGPSLGSSWGDDGEIVAIHVGIFDEPRDALLVLLSEFPDLSVTTRTLSVGGREWTEVLVGPYTDSEKAAAAWQPLQRRFPDSWIRIVPQFDGDIPDRDALVNNGAVATSVIDGQTLSAAALAERMRLARDAMLAQNYGLAIENYRGVLAVDSHDQRATAREYLGVAFERNQQLREAEAEYRAWLVEFGDTDSEGRDRVSARLTGLESAADEPQSGTFAIVADNRAAPRTSWRGGISQVFRRDVSQFVDDGDGRLTASALYNYADIAVSRRGDRFDSLARFSGSFVFDANNEARLSRDLGWVSDAFLRVSDTEWGIDATVGRQRANGTGVLTRFDGLNVDYRWRDGITVGGVVGIPIDTARYAGNRNRLLYGGNVDFSGVLPGIDASLYAIAQTVDGLSDREAVGAEVFYANGVLSATALVDYDVSYNVLNSFLVSSDWQINDMLSLNAMVEVGRNPAVTTRNALAGQTARTVDDLLGSFREGQIRTLALDRTPEASNFALGANYAWSDRTQVSVDFASRETDAAPASGGAAAIPATGRQTWLIGTLTTTSLWRNGDLSRVQVRLDDTQTQSATRLTLETRIPVGGFRVNPLIHVIQRDLISDGSEQLIIEPIVRVFYRWHDHLLFELEAGGRYSSRELAPGVFDPFITDGEEELLGSYINIGYRWEF